MTKFPLLSLCLFSFSAAALAQPTITYQGELQQNGELANGDFSMQFSVYGAEAGGIQLAMSETPFAPVNVADGRFSVELTFLDDSLFDSTERWLEITVDGVALTPRQKINRAPSSVFSNKTRGMVVDEFGNVCMEGDLEVANIAVAGSVVVNGDVDVAGNLSKSGGTFKIDHPLDPANKFLYHSFVESPEMMNLYNGNVTTNSNGYATVIMPDWFEALNRDFRYQLTVVDEANSDRFVLAKIVQEIQGNEFRLRTSEPNTMVSWQVTGVRHDAYAIANRVQVEVTKPKHLQGHYIHPELFGFDRTRSIVSARGQALESQDSVNPSKGISQDD